MRGKNFIIPLVVYPFDVMVSVGETNEQLKGKLDKFNVDYRNYFEHPVNLGRSTLFHSKQTLIRFRKYADHKTIAHEVFHAVTCLLTEIGMPFNIDHNDEAYAYLIGYLTGEIYKRIGKVV